MPKDVKGKLKAQTRAAASSPSVNNFPVQNSCDPPGLIVLKRWSEADYNELNPITWLNTIHQKLKTPAPPVYAYTQELIANGFYCTVEFLDQSFRSPELKLKKQEAKEDAAKIALLTLEQQMPIIFKQIKDALVKSHTVPKKDGRFCKGVRQIGKLMQPSDMIPRSIEWLKKFKETHVNERPCVMLLEFCQYHKIGQPVYHVRQEWIGTYLMDCEVNSRKFSSEHVFWVKKDAKDHISQIAFDILYNEFVEKEQADISRKIKNQKMRQGLYKCDFKEDTKKILESTQPTPLVNYSPNGYVYPYDTYTNYYMPTMSNNIQAATNLTYGQSLGYQNPNGNTNNNINNNLIGYNHQQAVDSYGCISTSTAPFFNNVEVKPETYVSPTSVECQIGPPSTSVSSVPYINAVNSSSITQTSVNNGFHPYAVPASHNKNGSTKKNFVRNRKSKRLCAAAALHKPKRAPEKVVSDKNGRVLRKKHVTLLHELCQKRNLEKPDFDFHNIYGGYRCSVTINNRVFTGSKLCSKKVDAKEEVAELAYKFYENNE
ncbi:unnamed protein product [Rhizophagus irregularis]|uniref:DRBM domain-containing protein n=1 Tax=Rhizophagus irregularis TaxID=588596 RepID=A0A2I1G8G4_9GLOM|nr:hypothetical protein RhiirA4_456824 [Rhizophagus irregularis]CAB4422279.1 unnamed protein product [Rhizophagus irregularis]